MELNLPEKLYYNIGEISKAFEIKPSLLRFWEKEFDILKPKKNISAWDEYMQGLNIINNNPNTSEIRDKVIKHSKKAIDLDANFCDAYVLYCDCLTLEIYDPKKTEERKEKRLKRIIYFSF